MIEKIEQRLSENIECIHLEVIDESPNHGGYNGSVSHLKIIIVSDQFKSKTLLERHRLVYNAMGELMETEIHALSINAKTPEEN